MGDTIDMFCPDWVLAVSCSEAARRFVIDDLPLDGISRYFSKGLSKHYEDAVPEKLSEVAEEILRFLAEIEENDPDNVCLSFSYNQINFLPDRQPRKMKGLFRNAFDPQKEEIKIKEILRLYKTFVFNYRSYDDYRKPTNWSFKDEEELDWFGELLTEEVTFLDLL